MASVRDNGLLASTEFTICWKDFISNPVVPLRDVIKTERTIMLSKKNWHNIHAINISQY